MAILCLSTDLEHLKQNIGNILVGFTYQNEPVYARDLKVQEAMAILLKDAIKPNLVQTLEGNPAIIHGGPFANIAQGTNTINATKMGMSLADYTVTEAGFGADLGAEKFLNIKCAAAGIKPSAMVIVATIRALRHHGGASAEDLNTPSVEKVALGFANLQKHIENAKTFGFTPVIAINHFIKDTDEEIALLQNLCADMGVKAVVAKAWALGGKGTQDLATAVVDAIASGNNDFKPLYNHADAVKDKIECIAKTIYGAEGVDYSSKALSTLKQLNAIGLSHLPICMAKTQKSFSDDEKRIGRPSGFRVTVREFEVAAGAGFIVPILGNMMRMPGLPQVPASEGMHIDNTGKISGLS